MRWRDRVYGSVSIEDSKILDLISCATFERLKGVRQAGPSALAFQFKDVTRYEHSLGVFILLRRLESPTPRTNRRLIARHLAYRVLPRGRLRFHFQ